MPPKPLQSVSASAPVKLDLAPETLATLIEAAGKPRRSLDLGRLSIGKMIGEIMRSACPVPGRSWDKLLTVMLKPGEFVQPHQHKRHLVMFYPESAEPIILEQIPYHIKAGEILYVPPFTLHAVAPVKYPRLSVAMLVSGDGL